MARLITTILLFGILIADGTRPLLPRIFVDARPVASMVVNA